MTYSCHGFNMSVDKKPLGQWIFSPSINQSTNQLINEFFSERNEFVSFTHPVGLDDIQWVSKVRKIIEIFIFFFYYLFIIIICVHSLNVYFI